jgi:hypothetical protein
VRITASCHVANATPAAPIIQYATSPFVVFSICPSLRWDQVDQRLSLTQRDWQEHGTPVSIDVLKMQPEGGGLSSAAWLWVLLTFFRSLESYTASKTRKRKTKKAKVRTPYTASATGSLIRLSLLGPVVRKISRQVAAIVESMMRSVSITIVI